MTYVPGTTCWNWYSPFPPAVWLVVRLVALFAMDTVAPGTTAPEESVIVPRKDVKEACDQLRPQKPMNKNSDASAYRKWRT
jgi:hypothetical protein